MRTIKTLLLSVGAVATLLLWVTNPFAASQCISRTTGEGPGSFIVNVNRQTLNGRTIYTYTLTGANANKLSIFVQQGLGNALVSKRNNDPGGVYVTAASHGSDGGFPPADAWRIVHHQDAVVFTNIAINNTFTLDVPERFKPEEGLTTLLIGIKNTYEHCGPIFGPTTPDAPAFEGSPLANTTARLCFENGCCYNATVGLTDGVIKSLQTAQDTPKETVPPFSDCRVENASCADDLNLVFCGIGHIALPPIQSELGGICYYPPNIKFTC